MILISDISRAFKYDSERILEEVFRPSHSWPWRTQRGYFTRGAWGGFDKGALCIKWPHWAIMSAPMRASQSQRSATVDTSVKSSLRPAALSTVRLNRLWPSALPAWSAHRCIVCDPALGATSPVPLRLVFFPGRRMTRGSDKVFLLVALWVSTHG